MLKNLPLTAFAPPKSCPALDRHQENLGTSGCFPLYSSSVSHTLSFVTSLYLGKGQGTCALERTRGGMGQLMVAV